jgi:hypothetical protein
MWPAKVNIQQFKTKNIHTFYYFCRQLLPSWLPIQQLKLIQIQQIQIQMQNPGSHIYFFLSQLGEIQAKRTKEVKEQ